MPSFLRFALRWVSYPLVFGGSAAFMIWTLYTGVPYWPTTPLVAAVGLLIIAGLERIQPFREAWLEDHHDTATDLLHMLVNLSVIQFTAGVLVKLGDAVPASVRLFPIESPLWLQLLVLLVTTIVVDLVVMHGYAYLASRAQRWLATPRARRAQNRVFGGVLMGMGASLLLVKRGA